MLPVTLLAVLLVIGVPLGTFAYNITDVCGIANVPMVRIVGGTPAKEGAWPWMVAILVQDQYTGAVPNHVSCGGSLLSNNYVLTSAHCVYEPKTAKTRDPKYLSVRFGVLDISSTNYPVETGVSEVTVHPQYDPVTIYNDLALLLIDKQLVFSVTVRPICLPRASLTYEEDLVGLNPFVAGWGKTSENGTYSNILRQVQVEIMSTKQCNKDYEKFADAPVTDSQICAGLNSGGASACYGDSGSPLMLVRDSRWTAIGVMSSGTCGAPGLPDVFTAVVSNLGWISKMTGIDV